MRATLSMAAGGHWLGVDGVDATSIHRGAASAAGRFDAVALLL